MSTRKTFVTPSRSRIESLRSRAPRPSDLDLLDREFEQLATRFGKRTPPLSDEAQDLPVSTVLAAAMLQDALSPRDRRRLARGQGVAMTVALPTADWMDPVEEALRRVRSWRHTVKRSGSSRSSDRPEIGNDACVQSLGSGGSVLGISTAPEQYLPSALVAAADIRVTLGIPSPTAIRRTIQLVTGRRAGKLAGDVARGLAPMEIAACIRRGSAPSASIRRLQAASASKVTATETGLQDVPPLAECLGYGRAQEWGLRLVAAIEEFRRGERSWDSIEDRNIVLGGDAGVGKTSFARSLAKSADIPLIATSVSSWFASTGGYLNDIVKAVDGVFTRAASMGGPVLILLDEIDSIPNRATVDSRHRDYWVPIVSHVLLALDSAVSGNNNRFIVIGATNYPERLDEALVRPGRLNRVVHVARPDIPAIAGILRQHLGEALPGEDLLPLAQIGQGSTGAEVAGWARGARMRARQSGREMVLDDLLSQIAPPETRPPAQILAIARHEASHALATEALLVGTVTSVSLVAKGAFAGRTSARLRETQMMSAEDLDALVISILAGRASDEHFGRVTSGSAGSRGSDLAHATSAVAGKHASWCLGQSILYRCDQDEALALVRTDGAFRAIVEADLDRLYGLARDLVRKNARAIDRLARRLVDCRVLGGDEVRRIIGMPDPERSVDGPISTVGGLHE